MTGHTTNEQSRQKRGLFNGVSYAIKWLFGTRDSDDALYYSEAISSMAQQTHDMHSLLKQQVHIIADSINDYNKTANSLLTNQDTLNKNINKFNKFSKSTTKRINSLTYAQTVTDHLNLLTQLVNELHEEFDVIISAILFSKQNIIHPYVITPRHLRQELLKIKLGSNLELPYDIENIDNAYKYIDICSLTVIYANKVLIFAIHIPLVTKDQFQLYNLIPLPVRLTNSSIYSFIDPSFPYLMISTTRTYYGEMKDLKNCIAVPPSDFICSEITTHMVKERPTCEIDLKTKQLLSIPKSCDTKVVKSEVEIWHPLTKNQWLFIVTNPVIGTEYCDTTNHVTDVTLHGTGILTMQPRCKLYTLSTMLMSTSNQTANYTNFIPFVDITTDDCCLIQQDYLLNEEMEPIKLSNLNLNNLNHAENKLKQFDEELDKKLNQTFMSYGTKWYNTFIGIIAIILTFLLTLWCCCIKCRWPLFQWLKRLFCIDRCKHSICINSHNTLSHSNLHTNQADPNSNLRIMYHADACTNPIYSRLHVPSPQEPRNILHTIKKTEPHDYEDIELTPELPTKRLTRSTTKKILKM